MDGLLTALQGVKALLTVGGWTGSQYFSSAVATEENRTAFVNTVMSLVDKYQLDGLDFEYVYFRMRLPPYSALTPFSAGNTPTSKAWAAT